MTTSARLSHDRASTLTALEVLRLMTDRLENNQPAEDEDVEFVLKFFGDVSRQCPGGVVSDLLAELEHCHHTGECGGFISASRRYTDSVMNVLSTDVRIQTNHALRPGLHHLEMKYVTPHCI